MLPMALRPRAPIRRPKPTRVPGTAPDDVEGISRAETEGRAQAFGYFRFLKAMVPGYAEAVLIGTSPWIGVRETRRILGDLSGDR